MKFGILLYRPCYNFRRVLMRNSPLIVLLGLADLRETSWWCHLEIFNSLQLEFYSCLNFRTIMICLLYWWKDWNENLSLTDAKLAAGKLSKQIRWQKSEALITEIATRPTWRQLYFISRARIHSTIKALVPRLHSVGVRTLMQELRQIMSG